MSMKLRSLYIDPILKGNFGLFFNNLKYIKNKISGLPVDIMVEPTNVCNLRCVLCPTSHKFMTRKRGFMKLENYKKIIDDIKKITPQVTLFFSGESFLHPEIIEMIEYASKNNLRVIISTNATKLDKIDALLNSGLEKLTISLDGLSKKTYEKYRIGADFNKVIKNIKQLCNRKKGLGKKKPIIQIQFICMKHNQHEVKDLKKFQKEIGFDKVSVKTVAIPSWFYEGKKLDKLADEYLPTIYSRYKRRGKKWQISKTEGLCGFLRKTVITWDGTVCLCCYDVNAKYYFGNVLKTPFIKIWNSKKYKKYRKLVKTRSLDLCKKCGESMELVKDL